MAAHRVVTSPEDMRRRLDAMVGRRLVGVRRRLYVPGDLPPTKRWVTGIEMVLGRKTVGIVARPDSDTLGLCSGSLSIGEDETFVDAGDDALWHPWVGRKLTFAWFCINYRGYLDGIQLGFDEIDPNIALVAAASTIREYAVVPAILPTLPSGKTG